MNKINQWLIDIYKRQSDEFWRHVTCVNHNFEKYGLGYKCSICDLYTGTNTNINKEIRKSPTTKHKE